MLRGPSSKGQLCCAAAAFLLASRLLRAIPILVKLFLAKLLQRGATLCSPVNI